MGLPVTRLLRRPPGLVAIAASALFFALMAVTTRTLAGRVPAPQVSLVRFAVGLLGAGVLFLARGRGPDLRRRGLLVLRGGFGGAAVLTYFVAIERLGVAPGTVLNYTAPVFASVTREKK